MPQLTEFLAQKFNLKSLCIPQQRFFGAYPLTQHVIIETYAQHQPVVIVAPTQYQAQKIYERFEGRHAYLFAADEFITAQVMAASKDLLVQRLLTLQSIQKATRPIVVTHTSGICKPILAQSEWQEVTYGLAIGQTYDFQGFLRRLVTLGYTRESLVEEIGTFSVRGGIVDIFPIHEEYPLRIEFFDDEIESIRQFDTQTQRTVTIVETCEIIPATEIGTTQGTILDYLDNPQIIIIDETKVRANYEHMLEDAKNLVEQAVEIDQLFVELDAQIGTTYTSITTDGLYKADGIDLGSRELEYVEVMNRDDFELTLDTWLAQDYTVVVTVGDKSERHQFDHLHYHYATKNEPLQLAKLNVIVTDNESSEEYPQHKIVVLSEQHISRKMHKRRLRNRDACMRKAQHLHSLDDIHQGDYVVHEQHGIGRYIGIETLTSQGGTQDYLYIEYQQNGKLYIPVDKIHYIQKYVGGEGHTPKLHKLGGTDFAKAKKKVEKNVEAIAENLITLYAQRESRPGYAFSPDTDQQMDFEQMFPYVETADQLRATQEIKADMELARPMDRLLCGDVGFGKTEVAFRAVFKAMIEGKQVVMLAPTTILAKQHYESACERFKDTPFTIAMMSRFVMPKQQEKNCQLLANGGCDFVIGTHRLLSQDIQFRDLGLMIIDEEHRFGVTDKERLKQFRANVDALSLSATPIPRTLQMSLSGVREMSLLETAPRNRYPVQTYVLEEHDSIVRDAIERELARKGQVFYLYNRVKTIEQRMTRIQKLVPEARIVYAHGQMSREQLEQIMNDFIARKYDVLVSTTIIETGIDIPNANTLLISDADKMGLAQLYQLRGRVGRSDKIAYAYLMYPRKKILTEVADKRLHTIKEFTELGSGFKIAMRDLAIRGAGDMLGASQSGFVDTVGFEMYNQLLRQAIEKKGLTLSSPLYAEQKQEAKAYLNSLIDLQLGLDAYIPQTYIDDEALKIEMYQRLSEIKTEADFSAVREELEDRFGKYPIVVEHLMYQFLLRNQALRVGVDIIRQQRNKITVRFGAAASQQYTGQQVSKLLQPFKRQVILEMPQGRLQLTASVNTTPILEIIAIFLTILQQIEKLEE
ncbi:MAG: transcription-repair coupling factor [Culicoidibacterales bacterium]